MSDGTSIEWTDATWNPVRGCSRVSPGCENCYAEKFAHRFHAVEGHAFEGLTVLGKHGPRWNGRVRFAPEQLAKPTRWTKPRRVFVNSMADTFHESLSFSEIAAMFVIMAANRRHTFQVLTKRPKRAAEFFRWLEGDVHHVWQTMYLHAKQWLDDSSELESLMGSPWPWPLPNVWIGVSVEDQQRACERIPILLKIPAAKRWLSCEPLLGPVSLFGRSECDEYEDGYTYDPGLVVVQTSTPTDYGTGIEYDEWAYPGIDWVVVGGESGPGARPCKPEWIESTVHECVRCDVPVFLKQWGCINNNPNPDDPTAKCNGGHVKGGCMLNGRTYQEYPQTTQTHA